MPLLHGVEIALTSFKPASSQLPVLPVLALGNVVKSRPGLTQFLVSCGSQSTIHLSQPHHSCRKVSVRRALYETRDRLVSKAVGHVERRRT